MSAKNLVAILAVDPTRRPGGDIAGFADSEVSIYERSP